MLVEYNIQCFMTRSCGHNIHRSVLLGFPCSNGQCRQIIVYVNSGTIADDNVPMF